MSRSLGTHSLEQRPSLPGEHRKEVQRTLLRLAHRVQRGAGRANVEGSVARAPGNCRHKTPLQSIDAMRYRDARSFRHPRMDERCVA